MNCTKCGAQNPEDANFCIKCGSIINKTFVTAKPCTEEIIKEPKAPRPILIKGNTLAKEIIQQVTNYWFPSFAAIIIFMVAGTLFILMYFQEKVSLFLILYSLIFLIMTQGLLSALGVFFAGGHRQSALTALGLSWFGFLSPFLAIGWLAALVELHFSAPSKKDVRTTSEAKKIFRIILVLVLANLGSMIGTFIAIPIVVHFGIKNPIEILKIAWDNGLMNFPLK